MICILTQKNLYLRTSIRVYGEAVEIIYEDLKKYIEIKINSGKRSHKHMRDESEAFGEVDVSRNFISEGLLWC
jgi:hypothetical protein